ncbi:MAG: hypothetical protein RIN55_10720 [Tissierellaceae bacterium]|nr:hypothetical protein [Tissierellaceae bacterium]
MKKDFIEKKSMDNDYIIIQRNNEGKIQRIVGKMKGTKNKSLLSLTNIR